MAKFIRLTDEDRVRNLCRIATEACELHPEQLTGKSRKLEVTLPRMIVSNICRFEHDIHHSVIANVLERDRTSIYHYERSHENLIVWPPYRNKYWKVMKQYTNEERKNKLTFSQSSTLEDFLQREGIDFTQKNPKVHIKVISGEVETIIPSGYMEFADMVKKIRTLLQDYKHLIEVSL